MKKTDLARTTESWEDFLSNHADLKIIKDGNNITSVEFPADAENTTLVILEGEVYTLSYNSPRYSETQRFQSNKARKSQLYELIAEMFDWNCNN